MTSPFVRIPLLLLWLAFGMALVLVPWSDVWDSNYFLYHYPALAFFMKNPFLRGAISGLGFMNILLSLDTFRRPHDAVPSRT